MSDAKPPTPDEIPQNFVRDIIRGDLDAGRHTRVATRFPPEPNGYLHIGHAKSICLNFGLARDFGGTCNLRFDDTNPETEDMEYVRAIQRDVSWLGFDWDGLFFASDYFERLFECAVTLIRKGKAYVESLPAEAMREYRGTITKPGRPTPDRDRPIEENLELFERMKKRRVRRRRAGAPRQGRPGVAQHADARSGDLPDSPFGALPPRRRLVPLPDV